MHFYLAAVFYPTRAKNGNGIVAWVIRGRIFNTIKRIYCLSPVSSWFFAFWAGKFTGICCQAYCIHTNICPSISATRCRKHFYGFLLRLSFFFFLPTHSFRRGAEKDEPQQGETRTRKKTWLLLLCMLASFSPPQKSHRKSPLCWCYRCIKVFYCRWAYNRFRFNAYPSTAASQARTL